ncbi:MAG: NitT/TauT family transport system substrate-binding protein, partial [Candidatus Eremiobacteraeota bacterium]|nr:NitT/TauT family transport system substrate-binding protein [Candidatus Eremiobacteraeota bacterium]
MGLSRRAAVRALAGGFALPLLPSRTWAAGPIPLRLAAAGDDDITPILYGQHAGLFKKAGLDVSLTALGSGSATAAAVVGGSIDIGKSSLIGLCAAHARGVPFEIIAPASIYLDSNPIAGFVVAKDANIANVRDLNGKTVSASSLKDLIAVATQAWLDANGGDSKTVKFIEVPASAVTAAIEQGRIVGATLVTPALAEALDSGKTKLMGRSFSAIGKRFMVAGWFVTKDWLARNTDTAKRFNDAFLQAAQYTDTHHAETVD